MHDSYTPLGGMVSLAHDARRSRAQGTGVGLNGFTGHGDPGGFHRRLVGRTPEYLGKKIQATEMKLVTLYICDAHSR